MGPDMTPVRTYRNGRWEVYLPGSSLKGVFRSHLEKVARTLCASQSASCNPFVRAVDRAVAQDGQLRCDGYAEVFCGDKFETRELPEAREFETHWESGPGGTRRDKKRRWKHQNPEGDTLDNAAVYTDSCPMCRLFGSTSFIGRVAISDAYLPADSPERNTEVRDGVGIDRLTGGAANRAKFELETVTTGVRFTADVALRNFECWQLGAMMLVVQDLADGLIRIGSGRSRRLGAVRGHVGAVTVNHVGLVSGKPPVEIWGLGKFLAEGSYGTWPDDLLRMNAALGEQRSGIRLTAQLTDALLADLRKVAIQDFVARIQNWPVRETMTWNHLRWQPAGGK